MVLSDTILIIENFIFYEKIVYFIVVAIMCVIGFPFMVFCRDKWNAFGRKVDGAFKIESPHTKNYNASNHEQ